MWLAIANLALLALTLGAIIWYSFETRWLREETAALRREAVRQTKLQARPFLSLSYATNNACLRVTNLGHGVARDVEVSEIVLSDPADRATSRVRFDAIDFVAPTQSRDPYGHFSVTSGGEEIPWETKKLGWMANFGPSGRRAYEATIRYTDVVGQKYVAKFVIEKGNAKLVSDEETA